MTGGRSATAGGSIGPARPVQLVGSVPLPTTEEVFRLLAGKLGTLAKRLPDGETGKRSYWITSQAYLLARHPQFEPAGHNWNPDSGDVPESGAPKYRLRANVAASDIDIPPLGYADAARESFALFSRLKDEGVIPRSVRFQVSLPTPLAFIAGLVEPASQAAVAPAFERRVGLELEDILRGVPHGELAIQWDACLEIFILEGLREAYFSDSFAGCIARLAALGNAVPPDVELGFHFCYGDFRHKHGVEPKDMGLMVKMTNALVGQLKRPPTWVHYPVPRDRSDDAYYAPLAGLTLPPQSEVYLGLVHNTDGLEGSTRRLETARRHCASFGVATECGFGRRPASSLPDLLDIHARLARGDRPAAGARRPA